MDSPHRLAITAIGEVEGESFIAASLARQGWQVIYRALSEKELLIFLDSLNNEEVTLFSTSNFFASRTSTVTAHKNILREIELREVPRNDHDFSKIIRGTSVTIKRDWATLPAIPILAFTSFGRSVGTSTIALNVSAEIAGKGKKVLLVDAHKRSPFLSRYLRTFGVNREVIRSPLGFSIFEADSAESFAIIEEEIADYEILVIDIGEVWQPAHAISGLRAEDYAFNWSAHFASEIISISTEQSLSMTEIRKSLDEFERLAIKPRISHLFNFHQERTPKERAHRLIGIERELGHRSAFLPRDDRALSRAKAAYSTLAQSAPKSALRGEITRYCRDSNWWLG
jgi:hypothetical protein